MTHSSEKLKTYQKKRDFEKTPEPRGGEKIKAGRRFVIQKHDARRLHYDFRIEHEGVMLSWAVTKGPSLDPADKRLAVRTEDHPISYNIFEGVIPSGYGAGTVMIWDQGSYEPKEDISKGLEKGSLKLTLHGDRLKGGWALVLMKSASKKGRENWLLIKENDAEANREMDALETWSDSASTGRTLNEIAENVQKPSDTKPSQKKESHKSAKKSEGKHNLPNFITPQLAVLADAPPSGDTWLHELKYDGYRIQALLAGNQVRLMTRNENDFTERYGPIVKSLQSLGLENTVLDGELVALNKDGRSDFSAMQNGELTNLVYYVFDFLRYEGKDLTSEPLVERKKKLRKALADTGDTIRYSEHIRGSGESVIQNACKMSLEGIVSKRAKSAYKSGRQKSWIKSKCIGRDEFVIGGYRKSDKRGRPFASLLVGEYSGDELVYRGRVGTGFTEETMEDLSSLMKPLSRKTPPFQSVPSDAKRGAVWLTPKLVAELNYGSLTGSGLLRHPSFLGLREDKTAKEVQSVPKVDTESPEVTRQPLPDTITVGDIRISSANRVVFPSVGIQKGEIARWYDDVAPRLLEFAKGRPASLLRCPSGLEDDCFFQKHAGSLPKEIDIVKISEKSGAKKDYINLKSKSALIAAAQMGMIEIHLWGSQSDKVEKPNRLVMDLDPDEAVSFQAVKDAAIEIGDVMESAGLSTFPLLTGGKGIHVIAPLERRQTWDELGAVSKGIARAMAKASPEKYIATASKSKRKGKIFIDWLRNRRGATAIAPYSLRARRSAPIATPVSWKELSEIESAAEFNLTNIHDRLTTLKQDPWKGRSETRQSLAKSIIEMFEEN